MKPTPTALNGSSRSVNARLADVEPTVEALLTRCDELLIAGKALAARVAQIEELCEGMRQVHHDRLVLMEERVWPLAQQVKMLEEHTVAFHRKLVTPWQRLVWMIRG